MTITRRHFLGSATGALLLARNERRLYTAEPSRRKPPFRLLYSNDLTNITSCVSPFHRKGEPFRQEMLEATVDEVAGMGVDAHLLQPGLGTVPLWPSRVYPLDEHVEWLRQRFGVKPDAFTRFVLEGGDIVQTFIDRCRLRRQTPLVSLRLNDVHHKEHADAKKGAKISGGAAMGLSKWYCAHPEYRIGKGTSAREVALNWAIPVVREEKLALVGELCERYDFEGLELDFLRYYSFFRPEETTREQRCTIITAFVKEVRAVLDRTAREGRRRWLGVRVPCYLEALDLLGLDLPALTAGGVDMVNASSHYFTTQQHQLAEIRRRAPDAALYFELCHTIWKGEKLRAGYDVFPFRRATREQLHTAAHLALARGADGISLFNLAYYREHGQGDGRGPFGEPPFDALPALRDPQALARQPQHWFIAQGWRAPGAKPLPLPRRLEPGKSAHFILDLAPPPDAANKQARLRIQFEQAPGEGQWRASVNGETLVGTTDVSEPFPVPYPCMLGKPDELRAWLVPVKLLRDGSNRIGLELRSGAPATVTFLDLAVH